jgi:hypothetical protein
MNYVNNFAFFWVGDDVSIPQLLVNSINKSYSNDVNIFFLTDNKTPDISGTTQTLRINLSSNIMIARLEAYSELKIDDQVFFLDADSLVLNKIQKISSKSSLIIFRRKKTGRILNHHFPEWYPEFKNKSADEMMPFLFGAIITNNKFSYKNFLLLLNIAKDLPARFHRWYGDQYSLKLAIEKKQIDFEEKKFDEFIQIFTGEENLNNIEKDLITFKGPKSKSIILSIFNDYFKEV